MSNPARLILLSGTGGSGTSTIAAATVRALDDEGLGGVLVDVEEVGESSDRAAALIGATVGALANWTGAGPVEPEAWSELPSVRHLRAWLRVLDELERGVDAVVVDCGDLRQARDFVALPMTAIRLLDRVLTPVVAMRRDATGDEDDPPDRGSAFEQIAELQGALSAAGTALQADAVMRLVAAPYEDSVARVLRAAGVLAMLGVDVDGIVLNRVARKGDDASAHDIAWQRSMLARLEQDAEGPLVWKSSAKARAVPKGRSVLGPLGASRVLRTEDMTVQAHEEEYSLTVPLARVATCEARVGRLGDDLVVVVDGLHRWLPIPSLLRRCRAVEATRTPGGLRIDFVPDPAVWRMNIQPDEGRSA